MSADRPLTAVIVDDEAPARALLREYLAEDAAVRVVAECANGFEAVKAIAENRPDLVLLDVQMPKLDGFEVLELIEPPRSGPDAWRPAVVFCTAYDEHALRAFEVHAVDYLLKPFGRERLAAALARVRGRLAESDRAAGREAAGGGAGARPARVEGGAPVAHGEPQGFSAGALAAAARPPGRWAERLLIRDGSRVQVIPVEKLDYLEAQDDYVAVHAEGRSWLKTQTLGEIAEGLDPARFVRIHRSYVLNLERLARLELYAKDSRVAILADGRQLPVSRAGHSRLKELM